ncbi:hypothetical protein [Vulcanococcus limneticus]|uniref:hypothetical protein n=1 Tax=Vulcanococcus limneticus TaxID=2170428 RepID=UPI00398C22BC
MVLIAAGVLCGVVTALGSAATAQYSPNCERNGKRDYCAITPMDNASKKTETLTAITFADHTVYEVVRNEASCKDASDKVRTCNARILTPSGKDKSIPAFYRGTYYEGGYKHEYVGKGVHLTYFFLD